MSLQGAQQSLGTVVVEAHAIQGSLLLSKAEQAWFGIPRLTMPSDGANLRKAKTKAIPNPCSNTVLVEPGRQTNGIRKTTTKQHLFQAQVATL